MKECLIKTREQLLAAGWDALSLDRSKRFILSGWILEDPRFLILWFVPREFSTLVERGKWIPYLLQHDKRMIKFVTDGTAKLMDQLTGTRKRKLPSHEIERVPKKEKEVEVSQKVEWFGKVLKAVDQRIKENGR